MKFLSMLLFTLLLALPLLAMDSYEQIIITKTSNKANLRVIKHKLNTIHIKMFVQKYKSNYLIYSQKFTNHNRASSALFYIKKYFRYAKILKHDDSTSEKSMLGKRYFVNFALGEYSLSGGDSNGGLSYMLESGYIYDEDIFFSLAYSSASAKDISLSNIYSSANYKYKNVFTKGLDLYVGGLLGYSKLKKSGFSDSASVLFGLQLGAIYKLYDNLALLVAYQGMSVDHIVKVSATKDVKFGFLHNLQLGVNYRF